MLAVALDDELQVALFGDFQQQIRERRLSVGMEVEFRLFQQDD